MMLSDKENEVESRDRQPAQVLQLAGVAWTPWDLPVDSIP